MSKRDLIIVVILFALWISWPMIDRQIVKRYFFPAGPAPVETVSPESAGPESSEPPALSAAPAEAEPVASPAKPEPQSEPQADEPAEPATPERTAVLENDRVKLTVSSWGATIKSAVMKEYRAINEPESPPVVLEFGSEPALAYLGLKGLAEHDDFEMEADEASRSVRLTRRGASGVRLERTITLGEHYMVDVVDRFLNEQGEPVALPQHELRSGAMLNLDGAAERGVVYLGADTLSPGGEKVKYWGGSLPKWFKEVQDEKGLPKLPVQIAWPVDRPMDWVAAKNKYFAQVVAPEGSGENSVGAMIRVEREVSEAERADPAFRVKAATAHTVSAAIVLPESLVPANGEFVRKTQFYVGPKKYSELNRYALHMVDVMEFGMWAPIGKLLLKIMNWIHDVLWPHNYGIAIMLLTIIIRIVFWPVTHKSTESMKRMQAIQPLMNEVRAKYKDNQQKMQQEMMALYKEHKVNPLGGCLPMLIQIPVFIALFVVLRSAIELRFAPFLWIRDLSQPENLLAGVLPIPLNILPIVMAVTMAWQQKLMPSGGDPAQQKMMMFMPVMMLVLFYKFAAGLVLYWTTNQCLMIAQQLIMHRKSAKAAAA